MKTPNKYLYCGITNFSGYWWCITLGKWVRYEKSPKDSRCTTIYYRAHTISQLNKKLRVWRKYLPKGTEFVLVSRYHGVPDIFRRIR